jgi:hypothetical protein
MLPNFVIAGAPRSGTTWLNDVLSQHPDIFMAPKKECHFFAFEGAHPGFVGPGDDWINRQIVTDLEEYEQLFSGARGARALGEASVHYLMRPSSFIRIRERLGPCAKVLLTLRNPVDRAFSGYALHVRDGREDATNFMDALQREPGRIHAGWSDGWRYLESGRYASAVKAAMAACGPDQLKIWKYDDITSDPQRVIKEAYEFLGVNCSYRPDIDKRLNPSGAPRSKLIKNTISADYRLKRVWQKVIPNRARQAVVDRFQHHNIRPLVFPEELRPTLCAIFSEDVRELAALTGLDFSNWM